MGQLERFLAERTHTDQDPAARRSPRKVTLRFLRRCQRKCQARSETEKAKNPRAWTWGFFVELRGIEPLTSSMPWKRSTN